MDASAENLKLLLGIKLKQFRSKKGYSLKELANRSGLSISFLSEIEKGKKYPKPEKLIQLAAALDVSFDELVSLKVDAELDPVTSVLNSPFVKGFPFKLFGISPRDIVDLVSDSPNKAGAFVRTFLEIAETYDMEVEHFLLAALRSYQIMHRNYFEDLETEVIDFLGRHSLRNQTKVSLLRLRQILEEEYGYSIEKTDFQDYPELTGLRSVWIKGKPQKLIINNKLLPIQEAFIIGRELGFCSLKLEERAVTSSWIKVESFEQVLNNFKASYFAGALLINRDLLQSDLRSFFQRKQWSGEAFLQVMRKYGATPEMFLYRLSQLIPKFFDLNEIYYLRFFNRAGSEEYGLTKDLNMSRVRVPHGIGLNEHYCRRWLSIRLLKELAQTSRKSVLESTLVSAQRLRFLQSGAEFFNITLARPLALNPGTNTSITIGLLLNDTFREKVQFWNDPGIAQVDVNETCERCGLTQEECQDRVAPNDLFGENQGQRLKELAVQRYISENGGDRPIAAKP